MIDINNNDDCEIKDKGVLYEWLESWVDVILMPGSGYYCH